MQTNPLQEPQLFLALHCNSNNNNNNNHSISLSLWSSLEMNHQESQEYFMPVDSFSQLPFLRPPPSHGKPPATNPAIRLFGFDVPRDSEDQPYNDLYSKQTSNNINTTTTTNNNNTSTTAISNSKRFECHYCCRNFPTSQALGGHQNAHKRERQRAKRAQIQTTVEGRVLSILNPHQFSFRHDFGHCHASHYPSWNPSSNNWIGSVSRPITGSPVSGTSVARLMKVSNVSGFLGSSSSSSFCGSFRPGDDTVSVMENSVSLDLHL